MAGMGGGGRVSDLGGRVLYDFEFITCVRSRGAGVVRETFCGSLETRPSF